MYAERIMNASARENIILSLNQTWFGSKHIIGVVEGKFKQGLIRISFFRPIEE